jgi:hypothetical protein
MIGYRVRQSSRTLPLLVVGSASLIGCLAAHEHGWRGSGEPFDRAIETCETSTDTSREFYDCMEAKGWRPD